MFNFFLVFFKKKGTNRDSFNEKEDNKRIFKCKQQQQQSTKEQTTKEGKEEEEKLHNLKCLTILFLSKKKK